MRLSVCKIYKQNNHFVHYHVVEKLRLGHFSLESVVETFWWLESIFFPIYLLIFFSTQELNLYTKSKDNPVWLRAYRCPSSQAV